MITVIVKMVLGERENDRGQQKILYSDNAFFIIDSHRNRYLSHLCL
jgi:hypothetical protein